jgi:hypothetical protein
MFSYPHHPWIPTRDNLVSVLLGLPTMSPAAGTGSGTEMAITTEYVRLDRLMIGPGHRLKPWSGLEGLVRTLESSTLESITMKSGGGLNKDAATLCAIGSSIRHMGVVDSPDAGN